MEFYSAFSFICGYYFRVKYVVSIKNHSITEIEADIQSFKQSEDEIIKEETVLELSLLIAFYILTFSFQEKNSNFINAESSIGEKNQKNKNFELFTVYLNFLALYCF